MKCSWCGKEFTVLYPDLWVYKVGKKWFCTWKCLRADEKKGEDEMPRMKKDGTPAKKPGPRKERVKTVAELKGYGECEVYKLKTRNGVMACEGGIGTNDVCKDRRDCPCHLLYMSQHMMEIPDDKKEAAKALKRFVPIVQVAPIRESEKAMTAEELEVAAAAEKNEDVPMTAEERAEKWPMIPTRGETKNGTWEIVDGYKGFDTLVGFRSKTAHEIGPLGERAYAIVLTVSEWDALHDEMDQAMNMMKL